MTAYAGLAILHASVAAAVVEALIRVWRVRAPGERMALRWLALLAPLVVTPAYAILFPGRTDPVFALDRAWLAGAHWEVVRVVGLPVPLAVTIVLVLAGVVLFVRDLAPWIGDQVRLDPADPDAGGYTEHRGRLERAARHAAGRMALPVPRLRLIAHDGPVLQCTGVERPTIEASARALDLLDDEALAAALLHELVHVRCRDPLHGWLLMAARALQVYNPVAHVIARLVVQDIEERADRVVADLGCAQGLSDAIGCLSAPEHGVSDLRTGLGWRDILTHAQRRALTSRRHRVLAPDPGGAALVVFRVVLAGSGVAGVLFFVV